jgi:broad specificity phosphatase PhoE
MDIHLHDGRMRRSDALRERYFGAALEGASSSLYHTVWEQDEKDSTAVPEGGGESVADVAARLRQFLYEVEDSVEGQNVVIVSHGDSLSILISLILEEDLRYHWNIGLKNCQIYRIDPTR